MSGAGFFSVSKKASCQPWMWSAKCVAIWNIWNGINKSITVLELMANVFTSNCKHLRLFIANQTSLANNSTPGLKESITKNNASPPVVLGVGSLILTREDFPSNTQTKLRDVRWHSTGGKTSRFGIACRIVTAQEFYQLTKICETLKHYLFADL